MQTSTHRETAASPLDELVAAWRRSLRGRRLRVAFADGDDPRAVKAALRLHDDNVLVPYLIGHTGLVRRQAAAVGGWLPETVPVVDVQATAGDPRIVRVLRAAHARQALDDGRLAALAHDPIYQAAALLHLGLVDACLAGATRTSAEVLRAGLRVVGRPTGMGTVSSWMLMLLPDGRKLGYADCAVLPDPNPEQLADIAIASASGFHELTGEEPAVAMLSYSTAGSAQHPSVAKVRTATALAHERAPELSIDGELQFDAAVTASVAHHKAPGSPVAGHANVFIFPNLDAGNIAYKITERLAGATALGPILQGLAAPWNDMSRGCSTDDISTLALIGAMQADRRLPNPTSL